jgi:hypothetical protein
MIRSALAVVLLASLSLGCAMDQRKTEKSLDDPAPVNCATADGDIRVLKSEKAHVAQQAAEGVTAIVPAGIVVGILTGTEGTKFQVATGEYNKKIDARIALIQRECGVK